MNKFQDITRQIDARIYGGPRPGGIRKRRLMSFIFTTAGLIFLILFIVSLVTIRFVERDLLSREPVEYSLEKLDPEESRQMQNLIDSYNSALTVHQEDPEGEGNNRFELTLTGEQLNNLLSRMKPATSTDGLARLSLVPSGDRARISYSIPFGSRVFFNVTLHGEPRIKDYRFEMDIHQISVGRLKNARKFKDRAIARINRLLQTEPSRLKLPFFIEEMEVRESKVYLILKFRDF